MPRILPVLLLTVLGGCTALAARVTSDPPEATSDASPPQEPDPQADAPTVEQMLQRLQRLSPRQHAQLTESMQTLSVNCPYTRASLQLPIALNEVVSRIDAGHIDSHMQDEWRELQRRLKVHVAVLDAIGVELYRPIPGDHLYKTSPGAIFDRAALTASTDPIRDTLLLIDQNDALVAALDEDTKDLIRRQNDTSYALMGQTTMFHQTARWHQALRQLVPFASGEAKARIEQMIAALDEHDQHGC